MSPGLSVALSAKARQAGASLLEVLIAFLLIAIATLGVVRLTANNVGLDKDTQVRLTALSLANQFVERARLNVYGFDLGAYAVGLNDPIPAEPAINVDAGDEAAARAVAQSDRRNLLMAVNAVLPSGQAMVSTRASVDSRDLDLWIVWSGAATALSGDLAASAATRCPAGVVDRQCLYLRARL